MNAIQKILFVLLFWTVFLIVSCCRIVFQILKFHKLLPKRKQKKVLYLTAFFPNNAGYHYRAKKWADVLKENGYQVALKRVFSDQIQFETLLNKQPFIFHLKFMVTRFIQILSAISYDLVVVRRSLLLYNEYGNLFMEKLLLAIHPNAVLDFDDDMRKVDHAGPSSVYGKVLLEEKDKFYASLGLYKRFIVGSDFLKKLVLEKNPDIHEDHILVVPTCVDYNLLPPKKYDQKKEEVVFGWIGSNGNQQYLSEVIPVLNNLSKVYRIQLIVISGKTFKAADVTFPITQFQWSLSTEVKDLLKIDIGLMPLRDFPKERGKCGFKLIQYMGLGIVSVGSAVGANKEIIEENVDGFLIDDFSQWEKTLTSLMKRKNEYHRIGEHARQKINDNYSFDSKKSNYLKFIQGIEC